MTENKPPSTGIKRNRKTVRVKSAKGRKASSTRWLQRQLNDPYVAQSRQDGYRSRAAYKLLEMQQRFELFRPGDTVVDLGAAPGSWLQIVREVVSQKPGNNTIGIDLLPIEELAGCTLIEGDFQENDVLHQLEALTQDGVHAVLSDMAANSCGHAQTDHIRIMYLCEIALDFAINYLHEGGNFCAKVLRGGTENDLLKIMKDHFKTVKHFKPEASRKESAEMYVIALGFKGKKD